MAENNSEIIMLNRPRQKRRGLTLGRNGRICLRSLPCKLLGLRKGDEIAFVEIDKQPYLIKANGMENGIRLFGRKTQLHGSSVNTVRYLLLYHIVGMPNEAQETDLVVNDTPIRLRIGDEEHDALAVITRTDPSHCR